MAKIKELVPFDPVLYNLLGKTPILYTVVHRKWGIDVKICVYPIKKITPNRVYIDVHHRGNKRTYFKRVNDRFIIYPQGWVQTIDHIKNCNWTEYELMMYVQKTNPI
jgi:hypothetical protein